MKSGILRNGSYRHAQHAFAIAVATKAAVEVGQVDRGGRILPVQPQRSLVFGLRFDWAAALRKKTSERRTGFWPIVIETLRSYKLRRGALKPFAVDRWLVRRRNHREQRHRSDAHAAATIREQRRSKRPNLIGRNAFEHVEGTDSDHRICIREARSRRSDVCRRQASGKSRQSARAGESRRSRIGCDGCKKLRSVGLLGPRRMERFSKVLKTLPVRPKPV